MKAVKILMIEDDAGDVELTKDVLEKSKMKLNIDVAENGEEGLKYLKNEGKFKGKELPDLIILDLNMPKMDGREFLKILRNEEDLKHLPVVILTTSSSYEDIMKTYKEGANCYVTKPLGLEQFTKVVQSIENFWLTIVKLPGGDGK